MWVSADHPGWPLTCLRRVGGQVLDPGAPSPPFGHKAVPRAPPPFAASSSSFSKPFSDTPVGDVTSLESPSAHSPAAARGRQAGRTSPCCRESQRRGSASALSRCRSSPIQVSCAGAYSAAVIPKDQATASAQEEVVGGTRR